MCNRRVRTPCSTDNVQGEDALHRKQYVPQGVLTLRRGVEGKGICRVRIYPPTAGKPCSTKGVKRGYMTKDEVLRAVEKNSIDIIRLWFPDILGHMKGFAFPKSELEGALDDGMGFDGSSIEGFARIHESDLMATTFSNFSMGNKHGELPMNW